MTLSLSKERRNRRVSLGYFLRLLVESFARGGLRNNVAYAESSPDRMGKSEVSAFIFRQDIYSLDTAPPTIDGFFKEKNIE